jgi:hypothetical protein
MRDRAARFLPRRHNPIDSPDRPDFRAELLRTVARFRVPRSLGIATQVGLLRA